MSSTDKPLPSRSLGQTWVNLTYFYVVPLIFSHVWIATIFRPQTLPFLLTKYYLHYSWRSTFARSSLQVVRPSHFCVVVCCKCITEWYFRFSYAHHISKHAIFSNGSRRPTQHKKPRARIITSGRVSELFIGDDLSFSLQYCKEGITTHCKLSLFILIVLLPTNRSNSIAQNRYLKRKKKHHEISRCDQLFALGFYGRHNDCVYAGFLHPCWRCINDFFVRNSGEVCYYW